MEQFGEKTSCVTCSVLSFFRKYILRVVFYVPGFLSEFSKRLPVFEVFRVSSWYASVVVIEVIYNESVDTSSQDMLNIQVLKSL